MPDYLFQVRVVELGHRWSKLNLAKHLSPKFGCTNAIITHVWWKIIKGFTIHNSDMDCAWNSTVPSFMVN